MPTFRTPEELKAALPADQRELIGTPLANFTVDRLNPSYRYLAAGFLLVLAVAAMVAGAVYKPQFFGLAFILVLFGLGILYRARQDCGVEVAGDRGLARVRGSEAEWLLTYEFTASMTCQAVSTVVNRRDPLVKGRLVDGYAPPVLIHCLQLQQLDGTSKSKRLICQRTVLGDSPKELLAFREVILPPLVEAMEKSMKRGHSFPFGQWVIKADGIGGPDDGPVVPWAEITGIKYLPESEWLLLLVKEGPARLALIAAADSGRNPADGRPAPDDPWIWRGGVNFDPGVRLIAKHAGLSVPEAPPGFAVGGSSPVAKRGRS